MSMSVSEMRIDAFNSIFFNFSDYLYMSNMHCKTQIHTKINHQLGHYMNKKRVDEAKNELPPLSNTNGYEFDCLHIFQQFILGYIELSPFHAMPKKGQLDIEESKIDFRSVSQYIFLLLGLTPKQKFFKVIKTFKYSSIMCRSQIRIQTILNVDQQTTYLLINHINLQANLV